MDFLLLQPKQFVLLRIFFSICDLEIHRFSELLQLCVGKLSLVASEYMRSLEMNITIRIQNLRDKEIYQAGLETYLVLVLNTCIYPDPLEPFPIRMRFLF